MSEPGATADDALLAFGDLPRRLVVLRARSVEIAPLQARQFGPFQRAVKPLLTVLGPVLAAVGAPGSPVGLTLFGLLEHADALIESLAVATPLSAEEIGTLPPDELLQLAAAVFAVNADFFVRWMQALGALPSIQSTAGSTSITA